MSLTDIMVLQALFGLAVVLLEFPSGYFADRVGYRASLLVGGVAWGLGWVVYAWATTFGAVVAAELVLGAGMAFISGADRALLWVALERQGRSREYARWEGWFRAAGQTSEAVSSAVGGWLYAVTPGLPFLLQVPTALLGVSAVIALRGERPLPGSPLGRTGPASHVARAIEIARFTLWHHPRLQAAMALSVALGLATFVMVWLIQPYMQRRGVPTAAFGPLWASAHLFLVLVSLTSARVVQALGRRGTLLGCVLLVPLGYAGLALGTSVWAIAFYLCFMAVRGLQGPVLATAMQEDAPGEDRASVLSLAALLFRLAFVVTGPLVGTLVDHVGLERTLGALGGAFTVIGLGALALFNRAHAGPRLSGSVP